MPVEKVSVPKNKSGAEAAGVGSLGVVLSTDVNGHLESEREKLAEKHFRFPKNI